MQNNTSPQTYESSEWAVANDHAECVICFEPMQSEQCCVLTNNTGTRICQHMFHLSCAENHKRSLGGSATCAICRRPYSSLKNIPDFQSDPEAWFEIVDLDGDGQLSLQEVTEILKSTTPLDWRSAETWIENNWAEWDTDGDGYLSFAEITRPGTWMLPCLRELMK